MSVAFSALGALTALRAQIEGRLSDNEDYRALKALERAIADVTMQVPAARLAQAIEATPAALILPMPQSAPPPMPIPSSPSLIPAPPVPAGSSLMQRLSGSFPRVTTAQARLIGT